MCQVWACRYNILKVPPLTLGLQSFKGHNFSRIVGLKRRTPDDELNRSKTLVPEKFVEHLGYKNFIFLALLRFSIFWLKYKWTVHLMIQTWNLIYLLSILLVASFHRDADDSILSAPLGRGVSPETCPEYIPDLTTGYCST